MVETRIRDLAHYALGDRQDRVARFAAVLSRLTPGAYLVGLGPHFSDIIRVGDTEIAIGRPASLLEESQDVVIDYSVNDATLNGPREVSRLHVTVRFDSESDAVMVRDESSSTGTWLLPENQLFPAREWVAIENGGIFSLGSGQVNLLAVIQVG
jgi:hypothetical protein